MIKIININEFNQEKYSQYIENNIVILDLFSIIYYERFINNEFYCISIKKKYIYE
jgi:hypothetical protein